MRTMQLVVGVSLVLACGFATLFSAESKYVTKTDIPYVDEAVRLSDEYIKERCVLDIYYPEGVSGYSTIVWFHGGGLKNGNKSILGGFKEKGLAVVAVNYRLHPKVNAPVYIEDAAASVAWVFKNIEEFGGDASRIFVSGSSAGGYLTSMVGLDKRWLAAHGIDANRIAGLIPLAGHTITHFTVRKEMGIEGTQPIIDELAPLYHVRADAPPVLLITGDRELEMLGRYEENAYMMRMMKVAGHKDTRIFELDGYGHSPKDAAVPLIVKEVKRIEKMLKR
ncbi:MAG: acetyl esterase/lipase [Candidatus Pelagisphaera sp.]|jgi:acetyl esterase/lipase